MKRSHRFLLNGAFLAVVGILVRTVAVSFNGYVSRRIGAEGMGLYSLVMSVYGLGVTLATSGVNLAVVRLTAAGIASGGGRRELRHILGSGILYGLLFGLLSGGVFFFGSDFIGGNLLGDKRCVISLRAMALGMPAISVTSAVAGYFTGVGRAYRNGVISAIEQVVKILLILCGMVLFLSKGIEYGCFALVAGAMAAESFSLVTSYVMYRCDIRRLAEGNNPRTVGIMKRIASIAMPVALGSYIRQGFTTAEHIAIPHGLRKSGADPAAALSSYGILQGMALPLVLYPSVVIGAFTGLLIPELTALREQRREGEVRDLSLKAVRLAMIFSVGVAGALSFFGYELGMAVYGSGEAGRYIRILAPLVPMMFLDTTVDCILKGIGEVVYTMKVNIIDAAICLVFVLILVPKMGILGYVTVIYVSEAVNATLSITRMQKCTGTKLEASAVLVPFLWAGASYAAVSVIGILSVFVYGDFVPVGIRIALYGIIYFGTAAVWGKVGPKRLESEKQIEKSKKIKKNFKKVLHFEKECDII